MSKLKLEQYNRIYIDSSPFIYFIERSPEYLPVVKRIFSEISYGNIWGISSYITLIEVLVAPIKKGATEIASEYKEFMLNSTSIKMIPLDDKVAETAAELRAKYNGNGFKLRTPDAIQIATAILNEADIFLTNDSRLKNVKEINVVVLSELI